MDGTQTGKGPFPAEPEERDQLRFFEERRRAYEAVLWQLPSVSIAAQAFLVSAGFSSAATNTTRVLVGALGVVIVVATGLVIAYQSVRMTVVDHWIRRSYGLWGEHDMEESLRSNEKHRLKASHRLMLELPTPYWMWGAVLLGFVVVDVYMIVK